MNTYLVPIISLQKLSGFYVLAVYANSENEAYNKAELKSDPSIRAVRMNIPCDVFPERLEFSKNPFPIDEKNDRLKEAFKMKGEEYMESVDLYDYMYWGNFNEQIQNLAQKALPEKWSFNNRNDNYILKNYLKYTFNKLQSENKVIETDSYCVFNTGLFSRYYSPIYVYGEPRRSPSDNSPKWYFKGFKDEYELGNMDIMDKFPERADYFSEPNRLVFNWHYRVNVNYEHILDNMRTSERLPDSIKNSNMQLEVLTGVIDKAIKKVISNYKLAVPHYYQNKIQLLIPLCFGSDDPEVSLVLNLTKNGYYQATTCLTMEMAYMDARLIAKPESNWLTAENILSTEPLDTQEPGSQIENPTE